MFGWKVSFSFNSPSNYCIIYVFVRKYYRIRNIVCIISDDVELTLYFATQMSSFVQTTLVKPCLGRHFAATLMLVNRYNAVSARSSRFGGWRGVNCPTHKKKLEKVQQNMGIWECSTKSLEPFLVNSASQKSQWQTNKGNPFLERMHFSELLNRPAPAHF